MAGVAVTLSANIIRPLASKHTLVFQGYTKIYKINNNEKRQLTLMLKVIS